MSKKEIISNLIGGDGSAIKNYLDQGGDPNLKDERGQPLLIAAISSTLLQLPRTNPLHKVVAKDIVSYSHWLQTALPSISRPSDLIHPRLLPPGTIEPTCKDRRR